MFLGVKTEMRGTCEKPLAFFLLLNILLWR
nr:MAG TPA: hypothetical protein [Caudoviricetes sp.]